MFIVILLCNLK